MHYFNFRLFDLGFVGWFFIIIFKKSSPKKNPKPSSLTSLTWGSELHYPSLMDSCLFFTLPLQIKPVNLRSF